MSSKNTSGSNSPVWRRGLHLTLDIRHLTFAPLALSMLLSLISHQAYAASAPAVVPSAAPARPRPPVIESKLSNGLTLLCRANNSSEIVSIVCLVRAGLPDEREEQAGLAALTAEALLKGTTTHPGRSFTTAVMNAGGNLRTTPGFDFTEVSVVLSKEQLEPALKLIADVIAHPRFAPEDVVEAREALKRRAATLEDDFTGASYQRLVAQLYPRSPYGRPFTGYKQTLDRLTQVDVRKFWQANYVQNRMWVAIVGDVDARQALTLAEKAFKDVPFRPDAVTEAPALQTLTRPQVEAIQRPGPAAQLMVGYLAPGATRKNYPAYAVLDAVMGGGKRARLYSNIREKHSLGYRMGSFYQPLLFQSHLVGYVVTPAYRRNPQKEELESIVELVKGHLLEQYRQLAMTGPTDQELARAKAYVVGRYALRQERTRDQAKWLAWNEGMGLDKNFDQQFPDLVQTVSKEQIQEAAKRFLSHYALVLTMPELP
jgi:zinc protease